MRCWPAGPDATPCGFSHRLSSHQGGLRERKRVKNLGRAKKPSPALGATALFEGGRFLGKPTLAEGTRRVLMLFLRQCGTYPRPGETSCLVLSCLVCLLRAAACIATIPVPIRYTSHMPIPARTTFYISCHVMSCLPDLRRCATRLV